VGDHHDKKYDALGKALNLELTQSKIRCTGAHLNGEYCPFTVHVYPSDELKAAFVTSNPLVLSMVAFFIFLLTSLYSYSTTEVLSVDKEWS
jgi:hypothetical protein